jgi:glutamine amidotransferase
MYIAIINYNMGNIKSVENAFRKIGAEIKVTSDPEVINSSSAIVLPGVGAFKDAINNLEGLELIDVIKENINKKLFLGICLGMQLLYEYSMEDGKSRGLGVLKGFVGKIPSVVKVPHMGWNQIKIINKNNKLFSDIDNGENFYFIHSYHIIPENRNVISSVTDYGIEIVSSIEKGNIYGFQFHPEKSSTIGLKILNNFWKLVKENS